MDVTTSAAEVHVSLLGGFFVAVNGQPVPDRWRLRKAQTLVKLLALAPGHRLHREVVVDRLWPDTEPHVVGQQPASDHAHDPTHDGAGIDHTQRRCGPPLSNRRPQRRCRYVRAGRR